MARARNLTVPDSIPAVAEVESDRGVPGLLAYGTPRIVLIRLPTAPSAVHPRVAGTSYTGC
jgi:hypothetical protein